MSESTREFFERVVKAARDRKRPSERNQRIADEVGVGGRTQVEVAAEFGLSQRRVSQICQQVDRWYSQTEARERGEVDGDAHWRVERELHKRQLTEVYRRSMRAFTRSERALQSTRSGKRADGQEWSEIGEREQRLDTASLRVALRVIEQQEKLSKRPEPHHGSSDWERMKYFEWIVESLAQLRRDAERSGEVPRGNEDSRAIVERLVRELLGENGTGEREGEAPAEPPRDAVQACKAPTSGRGVERPDSAGHVDEAQHDGVGANRTLTNGQGFDAPPTAPAPPAELTTATPSRSSSASGVEERLEAPAAECVVAASVEADTSSDEASNAEVATEGAQKFVNRSALDHGQSKATNLAELKRQARGQLEYQFGSAMSDQRIAEELNFLRHWEAGRYSMTEHSREQRAALVEWRRLKRGHNCTPVPEVARRRVPSVDDLPRTLARYDGHGQ